jgi:hypothetical protein
MLPEAVAIPIEAPCDHSSSTFYFPTAADEGGVEGGMWAMNRNMREPRKANNGARPCSSVRRRRKYKTRLNEHPYIPTSKTLKKKGCDY